MSARLSPAPQSQVSATPRKVCPTIGLMRQSSAPEPPIASTMKLVDAPRNPSTSSAGGRSTAGAKTSGGGSSIIVDPVADVRARPRTLLAGRPRCASAGRMHVRRRPGNRDREVAHAPPTALRAVPLPIALTLHGGGDSVPPYPPPLAKRGGGTTSSVVEGALTLR